MSRRRLSSSLGLEPLESRRLLATITVNTTTEADPQATVLSLREAIELADGTISPTSLNAQKQAQIRGLLTDPNTIAFNIPGAGVQTILPTSGLPFITRPVAIDGYTQPGTHPNTLAKGDNAVLLIEIKGSLAGATADGMFFGNGAGGSVVQGLVMNNWSHGGPVISQPGGNALYFNTAAGGNVVRGNFFGTDATGLAPLLNGRNGVVMVNDTSADTIGGADPASRNIFAIGTPDGVGALTSTINSGGIYLTNDNGTVVQGNYVGVNANGDAFADVTPQAGTYGITVLDSTHVLIGGTAAGAGNVTSSIWVGSNLKYQEGHNTVQGNTVGLNAAGTLPTPGQAGVIVARSAYNLIGGNTPGAGNLIAYENAAAVYVSADNQSVVLHTIVAGNTIGTDATGTLDFHDLDGVVIAATANQIGGPDASWGNTIAHSQNYGLIIWNPAPAGISMDNQILSNRMFANANGEISSTQPQTMTPIMSLVATTSTGVFAAGVLGGTPGTTYTVQLFSDTAADALGHAEGRTLLTTIHATARADGLVTFSALLPAGAVPAPIGVITATATGPTGNTSAFSLSMPKGGPVSTLVAEGATVSTTTFGQNTTLVGVVVSGASLWVKPTGGIVFVDNGKVLGAGFVDPATGVAFFTTNSLGVGSHSIVAVYTGDAVFPLTRSSAMSVTVKALPPIVSGVSRGGTQVTVNFNTAATLNLTGVGNPNNYQFVALQATRNGFVPIGPTFNASSAAYDASKKSVVLTPSVRLTANTRYRLTVIGQGPNGVSDVYGTFLNGGGGAGTNFVGLI